MTPPPDNGAPGPYAHGPTPPRWQGPTPGPASRPGPVPGPPMPGQPMPGRPVPGQPMPGQPMPGQPMPVPGPGGPPPPMGAYRPPFPPRRKKSPARLLPLLALPVVAIIVIGTIYYFSTAKPNQYMEDWYGSLGTPDTLVATIAGVDGKEAHLRLEQLCAPVNHCSPSPAEDMADWISRGIGHISEEDAGECFSDGCQRVFDHEGHKAVVEFERVFPTSWKFIVEVDLSW